MNTTIPEGIELAEEIGRLAPAQGVEVVVLPPFPHLWPVADALRGSLVSVGAQDVFWEPSGAYTGEVSPMMLSGWCDWVLVGHSERRHLMGETDEMVRRKLDAALDTELSVIVAVGETEAERDAGATHDVVGRQVTSAVAGLAPEHLRRLVIAYEPVWAIGTGRTASVEQAEEVCGLIRALVAAGNSTAASQMRILYGGSVTDANAAAIFGQDDIDGGLIGGASLKPDTFLAIIDAAEPAAAR